MLIRTLLATAITLLALSGEMLAQQVKPQSGIVCETKPAAVPTMSTQVAPSSNCGGTGAINARIRQVTVFIPSATAITVTLADGQGSPITFGSITSTSSTTGTTYVYSWPVGGEYFAPGGFTIIATGSGATFQAVWLQ